MRQADASNAYDEAVAELASLRVGARMTLVTLLQARGQVDQHEAAYLELQAFLATLTDLIAAHPLAVEETRMRAASAWEQLQTQVDAQEMTRRRLTRTRQQLAQTEKRLASLRLSIARLSDEAR